MTHETPTPEALLAATLAGPKTDLRFEAAVLTLMFCLPLLWLATTGPAMPADGFDWFLFVSIGSMVGFCGAFPVFLKPSARRLLLNGGFLRLLLSPLLPRTLPWGGDGAVAGNGLAVGFPSAHARLAAADWPRRHLWSLGSTIWVGRANSQICAWRQTPEGWFLIGARTERGPRSQIPFRHRSRP